MMRWAAWNVHAQYKLPRSPTGPEIISEKLHELGKKRSQRTPAALWLGSCSFVFSFF
jgi:hypothetical protein